VNGVGDADRAAMTALAGAVMDDDGAVGPNAEATNEL
jgi:hypothetical protein